MTLLICGLVLVAMAIRLSIVTEYTLEHNQTITALVMVGLVLAIGGGVELVVR